MDVMNQTTEKFMRLTLIKSSNKGIQAVEFGKAHLRLLIAIAILMPVLCGFLGYRAALWTNNSSLVTEETIAGWKAGLDAQREELDAARNLSQQQINAMTARIGLLQAHVLRLDAAGDRIVQEVGIDGSEFDFANVPAVGGPETADYTEQLYSIGDVTGALDHLEQAIVAREEQLDVLASVLLDRKIDAESRIAGRPITSGWLSSPFGNRNDPFTGKRAFHSGIDFAGQAGGQVIATATGVVTFTGRRSGYGKLVEISHGDGYTTRYAHNDEILVKRGDMVRKGAMIAKMGNTGRSTGAHVHYEVLKNGRKVNPWKFVNRR